MGTWINCVCVIGTIQRRRALMGPLWSNTQFQRIRWDLWLCEIPPRGLTLDFDTWAMLHTGGPPELEVQSVSRKDQVQVDLAGSR